MLSRHRPRRSASAAEALTRVLATPTFELIPLKGAMDHAAFLPPGARVSVTASPIKGIDATVALCEQLQAAGFQAVPHLAARMVRDWQAGVVALLRRESAGKRRSARVLSYGVNGVAMVLMVGVFSQTGGLTGAEVAIAGGTSAVGQKLLEAILGDQAVRRLTSAARSDLERRVADLLQAEASRFNLSLDGHRPGEDAATIRALAARLRHGVDQ